MKITFDSENKAKNDYDYPKLYLDYGERARIAVIETEPELEFVHNLRAPAIVNGEVVMETVKTKDGTTARPKMDFVGKHLCFGRPDVLVDKRKDPENCPTCAAANQYDYVGPATRRFAMHVIQYKVQPNGFKVQTPFQAELVAWAFGDKVFNTLTDIREEHGDLRSKDLLLGPCENKGFQNFDIQVGGSAVWLESDETKKFVSTLYAENKSEDLVPLIGRRVSREMAEQDVNTVLTKHAQAFGGHMPDAPDESEAGNALSLDEMLSGPSETPAPAVPAGPVESITIPSMPATPAPTAPVDDVAASGGMVDVMPGLAPDPEPTTDSAVAPPPEQPAEPAQESKPELDFASLLDGL